MKSFYVLIVKIAFIILPLIIVYVAHRTLKKIIKIKALLWVMNCVVFVGILGAELAVFKYYNAKKAARDFKYDDIGVRYTPSYLPQEKTEKK